MTGMVARLVGQIVLAVVLVFPSLSLLRYLAMDMSRNVPRIRTVLIDMYYLIGEQTLTVAAGFLLFLLYMIALNWRRFRYYARVNEAIRHIADGHFDAQVPVRQRNELSDIARSINLLVRQLKMSIEEERKAEQTKNELITNVSHDLRTPLTSIVGYLGLVDQDRYRDEVELRRYVQIAYEKSLHLNVLVSDLFEYTRMRHEDIPLRKVAFSLGEMLGQLLAEQRLVLEQAGMVGEIHYEDDAVRVYGDPDKLVRVFENLLSNAIAYGGSGKRLVIYLRKDAGEAAVEFVNYGEAIASSELPYLFDRFYRVDKSRTAQAGGSGLGLAIVKSIVELHGGSVGVVSDTSRTSFTVRLPLRIVGALEEEHLKKS